MERWTLLRGNCLETLKTLEDNSIDACVTDPPYGLSEHTDIQQMVRYWFVGKEFVNKAPGFMGKEWDSFVPGPEIWREVKRVLKPGGHLLAFSGSRTVDLMGIAIRFAGFEMRDSIMCWCYGSGFPKSLDVSKAIDKRGGHSVAWFVEYVERVCEERGIPKKEITALFPSKNGNMTGWFWNKKNGSQDLTPAQFNKIRDFLDLPFEDLNDAERRVVGVKKAGLGSGKTFAFQQANGQATTEVSITTPATNAAKQWEGWGTALKPAFEPVLVAQKPIETTVAENALTHGVGGLNIDACRVSTAGEEFRAPLGSPGARQGIVGTNLGFSRNDDEKFKAAQRASIERTATLGRWPPNLLLTHHPECVEGDKCHPECATVLLDEQSGSAEASRFFPQFYYRAKPSRSERDAGLEEFEAASGGEATGREDESVGLSSPRAGAGRTGGAKNIHPTVKPIGVMQWLIRLVCPPGGVVLDPFNGSGTTGCAAMYEGMRYVGCELMPEYADIAEARIRHAAENSTAKEPVKLRQAAPAAKPAPEAGLVTVNVPLPASEELRKAFDLTEEVKVERKPGSLAPKDFKKLVAKSLKRR